jgi:hypothetical protein
MLITKDREFEALTTTLRWTRLYDRNHCKPNIP